MSKLSKPATFGLSRKMKVNFFDTSKVKALTDEATRKGIGGACAYVRQTAINSMRRDKTKKQAPSIAPTPPKFRAADQAVSLRNIQFYYDEPSKTGIVGPIKFNQMQQGNDGVIQRGVVPAVHEFGGNAGIKEKLIPFSLAIAYRKYGKAAGDAFKYTGTYMPMADAIRVYGKEATHRIDESAGGTWIRAGRVKRNQIIMRTRKAVYPKRPFMSRALSIAISKNKIAAAFVGRVGTI